MIEFDHHSGVFLTNELPAKFHIHTIVRTPNGNDYGMDLLRMHYAQEHHEQARPGVAGAPAEHKAQPGHNASPRLRVIHMLTVITMTIVTRIRMSTRTAMTTSMDTATRTLRTSMQMITAMMAASPLNQRNPSRCRTLGLLGEGLIECRQVFAGGR